MKFGSLERKLLRGISFFAHCTWLKVGDRARTAILKYLRILSENQDVYLQWIPFHVGLQGNEIADLLAKDGTYELIQDNLALTASEIHSIKKKEVQLTWKIPSTHTWHSADGPGGALKFNRGDQTGYARFKSGHPKSMKFEQGQKIFPTCNKCSSNKASLDHLLNCAEFRMENFAA